MEQSSVTQDLEEIHIESKLKKNEPPITLSDSTQSPSSENNQDNKEKDQKTINNKNLTEHLAEAKDKQDNADEQDNTDEPDNTDEQDSENSDYSEYEPENMQKFEQDIAQNILYKYHPEINQINYKELLTLTKITKNKNGIIIDPLHQTFPYLTVYEKAKILGLRAKQLNHGSEAFVDVPNYIIDGHIIASMELTQGKIPFIIRRPIPNGGSEYWKVSDLKIIH